VKGADEQPPGRDHGAQSSLILRAHLEVIIENDGLPIEHKVAIVRVALQNIEQTIDQAHQL
jgi:hypothetical protein